ncbi:hypothetical protein G7046_g1605 [Stylonectria norvegica]|nr:hypothetical protein G7046_g1605 [Stylonectria norvegica]
MGSSDTTSNSTMADSAEAAPTNGLMVTGAPFGLEQIYNYESGGHHPVHLHELLHARYKVIHKLGSGGYANVWLCLDVSAATPCYVALKIIMAEGSTKECPELLVNKLETLGLGQGPSRDLFCLPLDHFEIDGPNGVHYAFVYPVLGPRVSRMWNLVVLEDLEDMGLHLRNISHQVVKAMSILHAHGICHGDFRPANILAHIAGLDGLSEDEVLEILGRPKTADVVSDPGVAHELKTAPKYLVYPIDWDAVISNPKQPNLVSEKACVIDFGESFDLSSPPAELGIPQVYVAPECPMEGAIGTSSDLWALGCTLFEIRTGRKLFDTFDDDLDEYLWKVALLLGRFPEPWWSKTWEARSEYFQDEADADGRAIPIEHDVVVVQKPHPRSLQDALAEGLFYEYKHRPGGTERDISQEEISLFSDLLSKLLNYSPKDRLSASEALEHDWFKFGL